LPIRTISLTPVSSRCNGAAATGVGIAGVTGAAATGKQRALVLKSPGFESKPGFFRIISFIL
jgi:hypothetical protein